MTSRSIPLTKLYVGQGNPRISKTEPAADEALMASIKAHGLLYPLLIGNANADGNHEVLDGGRRFKILQKLDFSEVDCEILDIKPGEYPAEIGLAANMLREAMHPIDESQVIADMLADGYDVPQIAVRFGHTELWVKQRQKLGSLVPQLKTALRDGKLGLEQACEATLLPLNLQSKLADEFRGKKQKEGWQISGKIRELLKNLNRRQLNEAVFDWKALYPADKIERDLFDDPEEGWFVDMDLFQTMQDDAVAAWVEKNAKKGWEQVTFQQDPKDIPGYEQAQLRPAKEDRGAYILVGQPNGKGGIETIVLYKRRRGAKANGTAAVGAVAAPATPAARTIYDLTGRQEEMLQRAVHECLKEALVRGMKTPALFWMLRESLLGNGRIVPRAVMGPPVPQLTLEEWLEKPMRAIHQEIHEAMGLTISKPTMAQIEAMMRHAPGEIFEDYRPDAEFIGGYTRAQLDEYVKIVGLQVTLDDRMSKKEAIDAVTKACQQVKNGIALVPVQLDAPEADPPAQGAIAAAAAG